jgi:ribonuclease HI
MADAKSASSASSNSKRKRSGPAYYAVKVGHQPGIYYSWTDAKEATTAFKNPVFKKFNTLAEAEDFMVFGPSGTPQPGGKAKFYGVQVGHVPGVYTDYTSVLEQVSGFRGAKHKSFASWEDAQSFVDQATRPTPSDIGTPISLKGHLDPRAESLDKSRKKQKRNNGSAVIPETNGDYEPGTGPLPPDAEDGFDRTIKLNADGTLGYKDVDELYARKLQANGDFTGPLEIYTDGAARGNGQLGAVAGVGIWFGDNDSRNRSEPLSGDRQTNQRAELTAISRALDISPIDRNIIIYSDSHYSIQCVTEWYKKWENNSWKTAAGKDVENKDLVRPIRESIELRRAIGSSTEFVWIKGHAKNRGNEGADKLATQAADKQKMERQRQAMQG